MSIIRSGILPDKFYAIDTRHSVRAQLHLCKLGILRILPEEIVLVTCHRKNKAQQYERLENILFHIVTY